MRSGIENRLIRLEQRETPSWKAYIGRPLREWPNDALEILCDVAGNLDPESLTDMELELLDVTLEGADREFAE